MVIEMTDSRSRIVHRPDILRAQELLTWAPRTQLKEGLARKIAYFEKLLSENDMRAVLAADQAA
jgi:UDP-glucuronate decarboxylase